MPTVIPKNTVEYMICGGTIIPIASDPVDLTEAYREMALGASIALIAALPFSLFALFLIL